ncbi:MAG: hypothetical protein ACD_2C00189G0003 [uncultured bacterium (gcode 4)]|uniref:Pyruvate flavodoxin/ferredoxin oxidoreductase pyrimidine binding domain-containing protein n=1 Tax=uncultured bacterium (gcode 4) TaxID=1234023 RepID=K2GG23_9BACT|nr:MAG: hypothetical protein ACD_2C00189G0003 [uncultured bacterium (gcode 4)]
MINLLIAFYLVYKKSINMRITLAFSGPAWIWVNTSWLILSEVLASIWYEIYADKEYSSVIKWWNNVFIIYISDNKAFISKNIDFYIHFDDYSLQKNEVVYTIWEKLKLDRKIAKHANSYAVWCALKYLWVKLDAVNDVLKSKFKEEIAEENMIDIRAWYESIAEQKYSLEPIWKHRDILYGNELIAKWAIDSWLEYYSAYPMTPASSIIDAILHHSQDVVFHQAEDEIAVAMSMLWAKFAWKRAMCWTSWGWFALMSESISYSWMAEIWWVYILSQRAGPSTWTPTFTGQWDIDFALCPTFGDIYPIVIVPSTFEEAYNMIWKALNWSDIYQHPVIVLLDKQFSESYATVDKSRLKPEPINRWRLLENPNEGYARYAYETFSQERISPYTVPWTANWEFIATSYEHDIYGKETEDPKIKFMMEDKRFRKIDIFEDNEYNPDFYWFEVINPEARKFFITFSSNRWAAEWALEKKKDFWLIIITMFHPIDYRLQKFFDSNVDKLVFLEQNQSWQFQNLVCSKFSLKKQIIQFKRIYNLYPIFEEQLWEKI